MFYNILHCEVEETRVSSWYSYVMPNKTYWERSYVLTSF